MNLPLPISFLGTEVLGMNFASTTSLLVDDLVKGLLTLVLVVGLGEGKCNFLSLLDVVLVNEWISSNSGAGGGEKSLYGEI
jgi:hypothetical protein